MELIFSTVIKMPTDTEICLQIDALKKQINDLKTKLIIEKHKSSSYKRKLTAMIKQKEMIDRDI